MALCTSVALLAASGLLSVMLVGHLFTPSTIFLAIWTGMLAFVMVDEAVYRFFSTQVSDYTYFLHGLSFLAFIVGSVTILFAHPMARRAQPASPVDEVSPNRLRALAVWQVLALFGLVGLKLAFVHARYGSVLGSLGTIRADFVAGRVAFPSWFDLTTVFANLAILNLAILMAYKRTALTTALAATTIVAAFLDDLSTADKGGLRLIILLVLGTYYAASIGRRARWTAKIIITWSVVVIATVALFSLITSWRSGSRSIADVTYQHLYGDIVGNLVSSSWFVERPLPSTVPGENSFHGLYTLAGDVADHLFGQAVYANRYSSTDPAYYANIVERGVYNTTDYVAYLYSDFGIVGLILASYIWGVVATMAFVRAIQRKRVDQIQALALITVGIVVSVRGFYYGAAGFWLTLLCVYAQGWFFRMLGNHTLVKTTVRSG